MVIARHLSGPKGGLWVLQEIGVRLFPYVLDNRVLSNREPMQREIIKYAKYLEQKHQDDNTIKSYINDVKAFYAFVLDWGQVDQSWSDISLDEAKQYVQEHIDDDKKTKTINRAITSLRLFFDFLFIREVVEINPFRQIQHVKIESMPPTLLTDKEALWLVGAPKREYDIFMDIHNKHKMSHRGEFFILRDNLILELLYYCGVKTYELIALRDNHIDCETMTITIQGKKTRNKRRVISIPECAIDSYQQYVKQRDSIWETSSESINPVLLCNRTGKPVTRTLLWRVTSKYALKSGLNPGISPEIFRNTFTLRAMKNGADARTLQYLLGLEDLTTARSYFDKFDFVRKSKRKTTKKRKT